MSITLDEKQVKELRKMLIARKIAIKYDYCLDAEEAQKKMKELHKNYFDKKKVTASEIVDACDLHQGSRHDEVSGAMERFLSNVVSM